MPPEGFPPQGSEAELLRQAGDVVVELKPDGRIVFVSAAAERVLGRPASHFTNLSFLEVVIPEDRITILAQFRKVVDTAGDALMRFRAVHRDGHVIEFETKFRSFINEHDQQRIVAICRDLTEQSRQGAKDREREIHHRAIAESGTRPAAIVNASGQIQFSNRHFREVFGNHSSIHGLRQRMNEENRAAIDAAWYETSQEEGLTTGHADFEFSNLDGTILWYSATWESIASEELNRQFSVVYQDITRRKKIEKALRFIAHGLSGLGADSFQPVVAMIAEALEMDRIVLGLLPENESNQIDVVVAWQDNVFLSDESLSLDGLPDRDVAGGEVCIHPTAVGQLMPSVGEKLGHDFESYAGLPLFRTDGSVLGIVGAYSRKKIHDTDLVRSVLTSFVVLVSAAIDRRRVDDEVLASRARFDAVDGSPRALSVARDVTERRRSELGRELLFSVLQHGADLAFVCEGDATLLFANEAARRLLGTSEDSDIERKRFTELLTESDAERMEAEILPLVTPTSPWSGELELSRPVAEAEDESTSTAIATEATIFLFQESEHSDQTYLAIMLSDISERRRAEEALRQSELRLSRAQKMETVGRLAGGIAHDFNNLLTAIIGYGDLVLDQLGEGHGSTRDVEEILRAAARAGGLTRQLLAFSRRQVLQRESIDLNAIVADIDRMMRRLIGESIELVTFQDGKLHSIVADPGQIEQVIVNLVVNARDAMPTGGRMEIETLNFSTPVPRRTDTGKLEAGDYVLLRIFDNGIGMDERVRAQIFEPFFTTKEHHEGTGLGLASAYGIVREAGGQIDVESAPDQGTTFSVYLPAATAEAQPLQKGGEALGTGGSETILVVEDSEPVRRLVARTLENAGYTVLTAESATGALRHCSRHPDPIDLLLTDVVLPKASGPEVARRALELRPGIRALFMSGFTDDTLIRHGLRPGKQPLLEKPFGPARVLTRVRAVLDAAPNEDPESMFPVEHS